MTFSSGTNTASRNSWLNVSPPVISRNGRISIPAARISIAMQVMPWCFGAPGSVRTRAKPSVAYCAVEVQTLDPVTSQPPSTLVPVVRRDARSLPASGSLNSWHQ